MPERLQKFLARSGIGSRRFCESLIKSNKIIVNEKVATIGTSVREGDVIKYNFKEIHYTQEESEIVLIMLNKPEGVISSNERQNNNSAAHGHGFTTFSFSSPPRELVPLRYQRTLSLCETMKTICADYTNNCNAGNKNETTHPDTTASQF